LKNIFLILLLLLPCSSWSDDEPTLLDPKKYDIDFDDKAFSDQSKRPEAKDGPYFGVAFGTGWVQDYPGSESGRMRYLAIPTYKSKSLSIDQQDNVKGDLLERDRFQLSMSFIFLFPTDSGNIAIRAGMPDLDWTLQLGPELRIELFHYDYHTMYLRLPVRFVHTTDFSHRFEYLEWNFAPGFRNVFDFGDKYGEFITRLELDYASEKYNEMFFEVAPEFATTSRPAYNATEGLVQYIVGVNYSYYDFFPWTIFAGANAYFLNDSENRLSPLVRKKANYSIFAGLIHYF
jgi:hypothetical protein